MFKTHSGLKESLLAPFDFDQKALEIFRFQAAHCAPYATYLQYLRCDPSKVKSLEDIPFLPIAAFKHHLVSTVSHPPEKNFESSGTTGQKTSKSPLYDSGWYRYIARTLFEQRFGSLAGKTILGLLPSYLERQHSSLVHMVQDFIEASGSPFSGFYLNDFKALTRTLQACYAQGRPVVLFGVTYALLDFADGYQGASDHLCLIETGGMKGRRTELTKAEVHLHLQSKFTQAHIASEYGMTELLSQAYAVQDRRFVPEYSMKWILRHVRDPRDQGAHVKRGGLNIVDLANIDTCCFIETQDLAECSTQGGFEILGRLDQAELRGCNLMLSEW